MHVKVEQTGSEVLSSPIHSDLFYILFLHKNGLQIKCSRDHYYFMASSLLKTVL